MDMPPVLRRDVTGVDARRLDRVDHAEDSGDPGPASSKKKELATRNDLRNRRAAFARRDGADNGNSRAGRAEIIGCPANQREELSGCVALDPPTPVDEACRDWLAELQPVLALTRPPKERDLRQRQDATPSGGRSRNRCTNDRRWEAARSR